MTASSSPLLLGIDAGTTRVRAIAFDTSGRAVAEGSVPTPMDYPQPGWAAFDAEALWQAAVAAIREVTEALEDPARIVAAATTSVGETGIGLGADGRPTARAIGWFDKRAAAECTVLGGRFGAEALALRTGMRLDPIAGLPKMMWFQRTDPEAFARTAHWMTVGDYLTWRLCGRVVTDASLASRTLALDVATADWAWDVIDGAGIPRHLFPPVTPSGTPLGPVTADAAAATGLGAHCVVGVAGHDHPLGGLTVGVGDPGTVIDSLGTSEAAMIALDRPFTDPAVVAQGFEQGVFVVDRPIHVAFGGLYTCGAAVEWFRRAFAGGASFEALNAAAEQVPAGSLGVHFLPHLRLGTPPEPDDRSRGAFIGLGTDCDDGVLYRALLEGIAYDLKSLVEAMTAIPGAPADPRIRIIGGGAKNELLLRIKATVYDRVLDVVEVHEAVSLGAALFAGLAAGVFPDLGTALAAVPRTVHRIAPVDAWRDLYRRRFAEVWQPAVAALAPLHRAARD